MSKLGKWEEGDCLTLEATAALDSLRHELVAKERAAAEHVGLGPGELRVLRAANTLGEVGAKTIASLLGVTVTYVSSELKRLEEKGLCTRVPVSVDREEYGSKGRGTALLAPRLTADGKRKLRRFHETYGEFLHAYFNLTLPTEDRRALYRLVERLTVPA